MSLLKTKPLWHQGEVIATNSGWVNPLNNEVLVAIGNLKTKLALEFANSNTQTEKILIDEVPFIEENPVIEEIIEIKKVQKMDTKKTTTKKLKVIVETTDKTIPIGQQLIAEVVEYDLDKPLVAE